MEKIIHIKKGLDIRIEGFAERNLQETPRVYEDFAIMPGDFYGVRPKLMVKEGDQVEAGSPLFFDKHQEAIHISSPVSGKISQIVYAEKRRIDKICIRADREISYKKFEIGDIAQLDEQKIKDLLLESGLWAFIKQRPFDKIADPSQKPKAIFISGFDTAPLAPDMDMLVHGFAAEFQAGIDILNKLCERNIHLSVHAKKTSSNVFMGAHNVQIHTFDGPHPSGNLGTQIHHISPINKGEIVWCIHPQDVITLGKFFTQGIYDASKIIALAGSEVLKPAYYKVISGFKVSDILLGNINRREAIRVISGDVLTGTNIGEDAYLGAYHHSISVIPEGNKYRFFGWMELGFNTFSSSRTYSSYLFPKKHYVLDANINGGRRAFVMVDQFEPIFPMDIYPLQLIKACMAKDIDLMEELGIYEIIPEDFALCEYVDTSKTDIQKLIRESLDFLEEEMG